MIPAEDTLKHCWADPQKVIPCYAARKKAEDIDDSGSDVSLTHSAAGDLDWVDEFGNEKEMNPDETQKNDGCSPDETPKNVGCPPKNDDGEGPGKPDGVMCTQEDAPKTTPTAPPQTPYTQLPTMVFYRSCIFHFIICFF